MRLRGRNELAGFEFDDGTLVLTEAGSKRRTWLRVGEGDAALRALDPGGVDVLGVAGAARVIYRRLGGGTSATSVGNSG